MRGNRWSILQHSMPDMGFSLHPCVFYCFIVLFFIKEKNGLFQLLVAQTFLTFYRFLEHKA